MAEQDPWELLGREEDLDPELEDYLQESATLGQVLKHPLVFQVPYSPVMNAVSNAQLRAKKEALKTAIKNRSWGTYFWLYERPFRPHAILAIEDQLTDEEYWELVEALWTDTENPFQWQGLVEHFFGSSRGHREALMTEEEQAHLASLPDTIRLYRGYSQGNERGWSWTTNLDKAKWFARRLLMAEGTPRVAHGKVEKQYAVAYLSGRDEDEIVVDPRRVRVYRTNRL